MEKINIAELLKDCPTGMELDCTMFEKPVKYKGLTEGEPYIINIETPSGGDFYLTKEGYLYDLPDSKSIIFPKGKTTWEGFHRPFKDGDIIYNRLQKKICIYYLCGDEVPRIKGCRYNEPNTQLQFEKLEYPIPIVIQDYRFATEEEKARLFDAINTNGYKWNAETKTLEKLPKFKVGNVIQDKDGYKVRVTEVNIEDECYGYESVIVKGIGGIAFREQDNWELVPNKFDINTLIPFESKVLVRHNKDNKWTGSFFSFIDRDLHSHCYKFVTTADKSYPMMIPFKGNEYLLGKTDDCQDFYKIWE